MQVPSWSTIQHIMGGATGYAALSYAARTLPKTKSPWGQWALNVIAFVFANPDRVKEIPPPEVVNVAIVKPPPVDPIDKP